MNLDPPYSQNLDHRSVLGEHSGRMSRNVEPNDTLNGDFEELKKGFCDDSISDINEHKSDNPCHKISFNNGTKGRAATACSMPDMKGSNTDKYVNHKGDKSYKEALLGSTMILVKGYTGVTAATIVESSENKKQGR